MNFKLWFRISAGKFAPSKGPLYDSLSAAFGGYSLALRLRALA